MAPPAKLAELLDSAKAPENRGLLCAVAAGITAVAAGALLYKKSQAPPKTGRFQGVPLADDEYLAVIVGAGPSGSSCGYYLAREGHKVALLDKAKFPRGEREEKRRAEEAVSAPLSFLPPS
jgi:NADPH-dependent 2,4-dienoyl-CoA reductase/sulfur reductase-like enzyme